ncbi:MAG: hypothetical protein OHK0039_46610 [Bacteroidia bacterium]
MHANMICAWKKTLESGAGKLFESKRGPKGDDELTDRLYRQIGEMKMELGWFKKKLSQ